jgi:hypothetical protein
MLLVLLLSALQAPVPTQSLPPPGASSVEPPADEAAAVEPYAGPLEQGLAELAQASGENAHDRALELAAALLASPRVEELSEPRRARLLHDTGLARARAGLVEPGAADLRAAAALAGPGELRATSLFEAGTVRLLRAEELRSQVPEIAQRLGVPEPPVPPMAPGAGEAPDPLALAREAYLVARSGLLERLRLGWRDADTRANLELVTRRLRELDDVERQREEEQQQQQDPQQQDQQEDQQQDPQQDGSEQEQPPDEQESPPEDAQGEEQPAEDQPEQPPEPEPGEDASAEQQPDEQQVAPEEERVLSREEVQRLLDQLQEIEEQARAVRAMLRERRRVPVEKDW